MKFVPSYVKARVLTHDPAQRIRHDQDGLISHAISTRVLLDLHDTSTRLVRDAAAIRVPTLVLVAGSDWLVELAAQTKFFESLGSPVKRLEMLPGYYHDIYHEENAARPLALTREFIEAAFARPADAAPLLDAHERGYTFEEYRALTQPLTPLSPKWIFYRFFGLFLRTLGRRSDGIRLGWESGFNSGRTLDYVYRNQANGFTPLGRVIDRNYLNGSGWRGIRVRRGLLERVVQQAIEIVHHAVQSFEPLRRALFAFESSHCGACTTLSPLQRPTISFPVFFAPSFPSSSSTGCPSIVSNMAPPASTCAASSWPARTTS